MSPRNRSIGYLLVAGLELAPAIVLAQEAHEPASGQPVVERIDVVGAQYLPRETVLYYVATKPGSAFSVDGLREDFRRLWAAGFLDDLSIEESDTPSGNKAVLFRIRERKRIRVVDFRGSKALSKTAIEDALKEKDASIKLDSFYDPDAVRKAEDAIRAILRQRGYPFATVGHNAQVIGASGHQVSITIDDGPKTRIKTIDFENNTVYSDGRLRGEMKKLKQAGIWNLSWLTGSSTYNDDKWEEAQQSLRSHYLDHGYVTASFDDPIISYHDGETGLLRKKPIKWMRVQIPVNEGERYRVGDVKFEGMKLFQPQLVRPLFKASEGQWYSEKRLRTGYERLRDAYGAQGYFQYTGFTKRTPDLNKRVVDLTLDINEDKQYFVGRINFVGNDSTRDEVIRREVYLTEGDVFSTELLKLSIRRLNQLGYFKPIEKAPELAPSAFGDDKIDVTMRVEEQNRNQFTFGGGLSGIDGAFFNASFSTSNFLGKGETVTLAAQAGTRATNYQLALTEPYVFGRPISAGFNIFLRRQTYLSSGLSVGYGQQDQGVSTTIGFPTGKFTRLFTSYSYQIIDIYKVADVQGQTTAASAQSASSADLEALGGLGRRYESGLSASWVRNTVDNPTRPRNGSRHTLEMQLVGGVLGGNVNYYRPNVEAVHFFPVGRRMALGVRGQAGWAFPFGNTADIPYYQRYFLGGETQIRGYDARSVAPFDARTKSSVGGDKFLLFNAEYYVDVLGPVRLLLFFDAGQAYARGQGLWWKTMSTSTGVEARFMMPVLNVPFRLIYAWNPNRDFYQPPRAFKFAVGTTF